MILWRISDYADLSGTGGTKYSARWHHAGRPIIYLAEHPALALLETLVHLELSMEDMPDNYQLLEVEVPDDSINGAVLDDPRWKLNKQLTMDMGSQWLRDQTSLLLRVPSAIVPGWNYLLNPLHPKASDCQIKSVHQHPYDPRLFSITLPDSSQ